MKNEKIVLNNKEIEKLPFAEDGKEYEITDKEFCYLHLRVTKNAKSFRFVKKDKFKNRYRITIGSYPEIKRKNALDKCIEYMNLINKGINPSDDIKSKKNEYTLSDALDFYLEKKGPRICDKVRKAYRVEVPKFFGRFMNTKLSFIPDEEVENIFEDVTDNNGPSAANHAIEKLKSVINYCIKKHRFFGTNPCEPIELNTKGRRDRFLTESEYPMFMDAVEKEELLFRNLFKMLLFTGVRKCNVLCMKWSSINFDNNIWYVDKTKNGEPLTVYLCDQALEVLKNTPRVEGCDWVFVNPQTKNHVKDLKKAWNRIKNRCGIKDIVIHDLRRSFATVLLSTGTEPSVVAKILGHKSLLATSVYAKLLDYVRQDAVQKAVNNIDKMVSNTRKTNDCDSDATQTTYQMSYNISTSIAGTVGMCLR